MPERGQQRRRLTSIEPLTSPLRYTVNCFQVKLLCLDIVAASDRRSPWQPPPTPYAHWRARRVQPCWFGLANGVGDGGCPQRCRGDGVRCRRPVFREILVGVARTAVRRAGRRLLGADGQLRRTGGTVFGVRLLEPGTVRFAVEHCLLADMFVHDVDAGVGRGVQTVRFQVLEKSRLSGVELPVSAR
jgi:hypothetical protein